MAALMFLIVSMVTLARSASIPGPASTPGPAYVPANRLPTHSAATGSVQPGVATILAIPFSVVATSDDHADDLKSAVETVKEVVAKAAEKVVDVIADVRDKVADVVDNVKDKVSDIVDDAKAGGSSHRDDAVISKTNDNSNETSDASDETDIIDDNSKELKSDGGNSSASTDDVSSDNDKKTDDDDDSKNRLNTGKSSTEVRRGGSSNEKKDNRKKDDSKEEDGDKDVTNQHVNGTEDSSERQDDSKKDNDDHDKDKYNNDDDSREKGDRKSMWTWLKGLTGDIENESGDDDAKIRHYFTQISKVRGYLDAIDSSIAVSQAKHSGTCPVYPVQVGNNRVTISTGNGCKIIIKLKGLTVDNIDDGHQDKKKTHKRSVLVSYSDN